MTAVVSEEAQAFLNWVAPLIPPLLTELGKIVLAIAQWVVGQLPFLLNLALQLGTAGTAFWARRIDKTFCSPACRMRAWRAVAMLAGTHGNVGGRFARVPAA